MRYASGKYANAICDRCGHRVPYLSLVTEAQTGLKVCPECEDEPERLVPREPDAVLLREPRPDTTE